MFSSIVLLGGTGDVGRRVVNLLNEKTDCRIYLASRNGGLVLDTSASPAYVSALEPNSRPGSVMGRLAGRQCEMVFLMMRSQCHHADKPEPRELLQV
ncbi:hypothetical protein LAB1_49490 [Roseibium sp. LAB1]